MEWQDDLFVWKTALGFQCPISLHPTMEKYNLVLSKTKIKPVPSFCFILKFSLLEPTESAVGPSSCYTHMVLWFQARENT